MECQVLDACASQLLEGFGLGTGQSEEVDPEQQTFTCFGPQLSCCYRCQQRLFKSKAHSSRRAPQAVEETQGIMRGLGSQFGYANNTRRVCWATPHMNLTSLSCEDPWQHSVQAVSSGLINHMLTSAIC